jgi:hypothetical protein
MTFPISPGICSWDISWNSIPYSDDQLLTALKAIADGYPYEIAFNEYTCPCGKESCGQSGKTRYIRVENPKFKEDNGENPYLVIVNV